MGLAALQSEILQLPTTGFFFEHQIGTRLGSRVPGPWVFEPKSLSFWKHLVEFSNFPWVFKSQPWVIKSQPIEDGKPLEQSVAKRADGSTILIFITELFVHENHNDKWTTKASSTYFSVSRKRCAKQSMHCMECFRAGGATQELDTSPSDCITSIMT